MGNGITFDTHKFVTGLVAKKMPKQQAEFLADTYNDLFTDRLATKADVRSEIKSLRDELKKDMELMEERQTRRMAQQHTATVIILAGLMAAFRFWF